MGDNVGKLCCAVYLIALLACKVSAKKEESQSSFNDHLQLLSELKREDPLIRINSTTFDILSKGGNFHYKIIALFTTLNPDRGCSVCIPAFKEFATVAQSFENDGRKDKYPFQVYFALVDFDESPSIFRKLKIVTAPLLLHLSGLRIRAGSFDKFDIKSTDVTAEKMALWISDRTGVQIIVSPRVTNTIESFWLIGIKITSIILLLIFFRQMYKQLKTKGSSPSTPSERPILKPVYRKRMRGESFPKQKLCTQHNQEVQNQQPRAQENNCRHKRTRKRMTCNF